MAARVGLAAVSYGIGVQNRYSAFLDDEDGFGSPVVQANPMASVGPKRAEHAKPKIAMGSQQQGAKSSGISHNNGSSNSTAKINGRAANNKATDPQQKSADQQKRNDGKRQRAGQQNQPGVTQAPNNGKQQAKQGNSNQETTANNRFLRNQQPNSNNHHQSNVSHQLNLLSKENNGAQQQRKPNRTYSSVNNQRVGNRRQFFNDDKKATPVNATAQHLIEDVSANSFGNVIGTQSNEEEKRRRQQKRALDLKHKDPEKREARRQLVEATEQSNTSRNQAETAQGDNLLAQRGQRNRRQVGDGIRNQDDTAATRGFKGLGVGGVRSRGRRTELGSSEQNEGERRDGQQAGRPGPRQGVDRPQRNRNGFGAGSRGSRGSRGDDQGKFGRDLERQKPIPNFSDKLDFPSLAS